MDQDVVGSAPCELPSTTDKQGGNEHSSGLSSSGPLNFAALDADFLVPGDMELQAGPLEEVPLQLNACGLVTRGEESGACGQVEEDLDVNFFSDLLQPEGSARVEMLSESGDSSPTADSTSSDAADNSRNGSSPEARGTGPRRPKRAKTSESPASSSSSSSSSSTSPDVVDAEPDAEREGQLVDRKARRRAQVASSARRLRCKKKHEMATLKTEATFLEQQLETLRLKHKQMRASSAVACWEEKAIAQRHERRHAEKMNEQLRQALFMQSGFVRNLRSMFFGAMPSSAELNMRNFLHTPTRLLNDPLTRVANLERVCTDAKLDMAKQIILQETQGINPWTTPNITCQQIDLGRDGFGMTTVAVYAMETRNACKTFKAACRAIIHCGAVWPNYTLVNSSLKAVDLPPTKLNIRYGISHNTFQSDATGDRISVETREISYCRWGENSGIFLWDYVDVDDMNPLQKDTKAMRCTIGAVLVRPEICMDGVERIVCRNICTKTHLLEFSELTPTLEQFSRGRQLCAQICGSLVYESIKTESATP